MSSFDTHPQDSPFAATPLVDVAAPRKAGWAGAVSAGLALGVAELIAGVVDSVPSAVSSVGSFVVDWAPSWVKQVAIDLFGTADKGALAIGTSIIALLIGIVVGRLSLRRRTIPAAVFGAFGALGIGAGLTQPLINPGLTIVAIAGAAALGWWALSAMLDTIAPRRPEAPTDSLPIDPSRRDFTRLVTGAGFAAVAAGGVGRSLIIRRSEATIGDTTLPPVATSPAVAAENQFVGINGLVPIVVPNDDFYRIDTALVIPRPNPDDWQMRVTGMVDNELTFTLDDLLAMPLVERYVTIACVSNNVGGDLIGNALWTGVRLVDVLEQAGVHSEATQIVGRSVDGARVRWP